VGWLKAESSIVHYPPVGNTHAPNHTNNLSLLPVEVRSISLDFSTISLQPITGSHPQGCGMHTHIHTQTHTFSNDVAKQAC